MRDLARCRSLRAPPAVRRPAAQGWQRRWWAQLSVAVQQAVGSTALGRAWPAAPQGPGLPEPPLEHVRRLAADAGASRLPFSHSARVLVCSSRRFTCDAWKKAREKKKKRKKKKKEKKFLTYCPSTCFGMRVSQSTRAKRGLGTLWHEPPGIRELGLVWVGGPTLPPEQPGLVALAVPPRLLPPSCRPRAKQDLLLQGAAVCMAAAFVLCLPSLLSPSAVLTPLDSLAFAEAHMTQLSLPVLRSRTTQSALLSSLPSWVCH